MVTFETKINDIPCYCRVDHYSPGRPDKVSGPMEDAEEGYDEEFSYTILDHRKIKAPWLEKQMTEEDVDRLLEEYHVTRLEFKHYINEPNE
jgi:hypothetical protein